MAVSRNGMWRLGAGAVAAAGLGAAVVATVVRAEAPGEVAPAEAPAADPAHVHGETFTQAGQDRRHAAKFGRQHTPSPLVIRDQTIPLRFSHRLHLADLACTDCHGMVEDSVRSEDVNLPEEETCFDCHDVNAAAKEPPGDPPALCSTCHPGFEPDFPEGTEDLSKTDLVKVHPPAWELPPPNLKFNHKVHLAKQIDCKTCHGDLTEIDFATRELVLPVMGKCLECHNGKDAPEECRTCHLTTPDGRIDVHAAHRPLEPAGWYFGDAHDDKWLENHKAVAQLGDGYCSNCHAPKECLDCHNGVKKPLKIHPNNWILQHPIAARKLNPDCTSCHREQTFCVGCHQQLKVTWEGERGDANPSQGQADLFGRGLRFHPEGWADYGTQIRGENHHSFQAQRNIRACMGCHTEQTCLTCHSMKTETGGFGRGAAIDPHPIGFAGSSQCKAMFKRNHRACVKCHTLADPELDDCR